MNSFGYSSEFFTIKYKVMKRYNLFLCLLLSGLLFVGSCNKIDLPFGKDHGHSKQTKTYASEVLADWIKLDLQLLRSNASKLNNFVMMHHWVYSSIALYEAVVPGMPGYQTLSGQLNAMPAMPETERERLITGPPLPIRFWLL